MVSPLAQILATANRPPPAPPQTTVAPTNVAGIYANHDSQLMDQYKAQLAQQNAKFGGLASLGSAAIGAGGKMLGGSSPGALSSGDTAAIANAMGVSADDIGAGVTWADVLPALLAMA